MRRRTFWAIVALAAATAVMPIPASIVERWYSGLAYPLLQRGITPLSNLVPFALFDVLCIWAIAAIVILLYRRVGALGWRQGLLRAGPAIVTAAAVAYLAFALLWGLNYRRVALVDKLQFDRGRVNQVSARQLGGRSAAELNRLYAAAHQGAFSPATLEAALQGTIAALGGRTPVVPGRPKQTLLGGYFHQVSVSGMTDPFFLETLIAPDLLDVERPFVIAHEWAHLAGYADESEANFVAWLACRHADETARYSAAFEMLGYAPPESLRQALDIGPRIDLLAVQYRYARTSPVLRTAARQGYDAYLKANRVEKGVESYDAVVQLILGTAIGEDGYPRRR